MIRFYQGKRSKTSGVLVFSVLLLLIGCDKEEDSKAHLQKGLEYINKGEYEKAKLELKTSSQAEKDNAETYYALALLDEKNRQYRAMRENLQKTVELAPSNTEARLKLGKVQILFNEPAAAIEQAEIILKGASGNLDAQVLKASALLRQKKLDEALNVIDGILTINPNHADALSLKALIYMDKDDLTQALALINMAIKADPKSISLHIFKIQLDAKRKDADAVIADYRNLIALYPDNQDFKVTLSKIYVQTGKTKEAEELIRGLVAAEPNNVKPKLILLDFLSATSKEKVVEQFHQFTEQHRDQPRLLLNLSSWMIARNNFDEAKKALGRVIELEEDSKVGLSAKTLLAKMAFDSKDFDGAEKIVQEILDDNSNYDDAKILRARLLLVKEKYDDAIELLNKVLFSQPNSSEALLLLGQALLVKGDQKQADKSFTSALNADPGNLQALTYVYEKALATNNVKYAKEILEKAISLNAGNIGLLEKLAKLNLSESDWVGAKSVVDAIAGLSNPLANDLANFLQGQIYQGQGDCVKAVAAYRDLLSKLPENSDALGSMARCYENMNKRPEMIAFLNELLVKNPLNISAGVLLSELYILDKNYDKGSALLANLVNGNPKNPQLYVSLARIKLAQNDGNAAIAVYRNGLDQIPENFKLTLSLASVYELQKDYDSAVALYRAMLKKNPQLDVAINNLASILTDHSSNEESLKEAAQLTEKFKDSDQPYFRDTYAWVLIKQGKIDEGLKLLNDLVIKSPEVAVFRYHLGFANYKNGSNAQAISELKQALELAKHKENPLDAKAIETLLDEIIAKTTSY
ncbi:MAG: tetratricopeptide repeat protein [Methylococcaceae bacterium]|nr:tetratricopeptide repeat protein [Methylococcaceae bacterium]